VVVWNPRASIWVGNSKAPPPGYLSSHSRYQLLLDQISIYELDGKVAAGVYVEWDMKAFADSKKHKDLWTAIGADAHLRSFMAKAKNMKGLEYRSVYAEASGGYPLGKYVGMIGLDARRLQGLFVQSLGHRNRVPCSKCENRYRSSQIHLSDPKNPSDQFHAGPVRNPGQDDDTMHVQTPFFGCISVPGFHNSACGNCLFHVEGHQCSFASSDWAGMPRFEGLRGSRRRSEDMGPRALNAKTAPRKGDPQEPDRKAIGAAQREARKRYE